MLLKEREWGLELSKKQSWSEIETALENAIS